MAKKIITDKYEMSFDFAESNITAPIKLTKKEYTKRLNEALEKHLKSQDLEREFQIDHFTKEYDYGTAIMIRHYFTCGCSDFILEEWHCKEGYRFIK
jgi:hypothetical protein